VANFVILTPDTLYRTYR